MLVYWQMGLIGKQVLLLVVKLGVGIKAVTGQFANSSLCFRRYFNDFVSKRRRLISCQQATKRRFANTLSSISSSVLLLIPETQGNYTVYYTANLSAMIHCDQ